MKIIPVDGVKKIDEQALNKQDKESKGVMAKIGDLVRKVINCCIE
jgi:hypothetical protein